MNFVARAQDQSPCAPTRQAFGFLQVRSTAGCPFSAIVEVLKTQTLADGTHIQTKAKVLVYRDSYGRVSYYSYQPVGLDEPYQTLQILFKSKTLSQDLSIFSPLKGPTSLRVLHLLLPRHRPRALLIQRHLRQNPRSALRISELRTF